jgi:hypothetical protein
MAFTALTLEFKDSPSPVTLAVILAQAKLDPTFSDSQLTEED